jgi:hypothetical protein
MSTPSRMLRLTLSLLVAATPPPAAGATPTAVTWSRDSRPTYGHRWLTCDATGAGP